MRWNIIGHEKAVALLESSLKQGRLSHAYLFLGPDGVGKKTLALELAKAVNCFQPEPPCGRCRSCLRTGSGNHSDVISYNLTDPVEEPADSSGNEETVSSRREVSVKKIEQLQDIAHLTPFEGRKKVFIIEEADRLSEEASNRLLKILEEPPPTVLIILLARAGKTTASAPATRGGLLATIVSRCQVVELHPLPLSALEKTLASAGMEARKASHIARISQGRMGWALRYRQNPQLLKEREEKLSSLIPLTGADIETRFSFAAKLAEGGNKEWEKVLDTLSLWLLWWRDLLLWKNSAREHIVNLEHEAFISRQAAKLETEQIARALFYLQRARTQLEARANMKLALEDLMLHLPTSV